MRTISNKYIFRNIYRLFKKENVRAYAVGGFIRDIKMKRQTHDIDIVVSTRAMSMAKKYSHLVQGNFVILDNENKIYRVLKKSGNKLFTIDFSLMRGKNIEDDLNSRDFTINAIARLIDSSSPRFNDKSLIDPLKGLRDIEHKIIRKVSERIFADDSLRLLRAYRFAATLKCRIETGTEEIIHENVKLIKNASAERIKDELFKILSVDNSCKWIDRMSDNGLLEHIIPEVSLMKKARDHYYHINSLWEHSVKTLESLEKIMYDINSIFPMASSRLRRHLESEIAGGIKRAVILKFCSLFHDIAKPATATDEHDRVRFYGHEKKGAGMAVCILKRLRASNREARLAEILIGQHMRPANLSISKKLTDRAIFRYFRDTDEAGIDILLLSLADRYSYKCCKIAGPNKFLPLKKQMEFTNKMANHYYYKKSKINPPYLLNGNDIMKNFGINEGPRIGKLLNIVRESQAEGKVKSRKSAIKLLKEYI